MPERAARCLWRAPALLLLLAATAFAVYNTAPPAVAERVLFRYALSLVFGPSLVDPWSRWKRASIGAAVAASLVVPILWLAKEGYRMTAVFSVPEAVDYAANPLSLGLFGAAALQMAAAERFVRRARTGRWGSSGGPTFTLVAILALGIAAGVMTRGSGGREIFYVYIALYRTLFGDG